jgi:hypothetical protein
MTEVATQSRNARQSKFTPDKIRQIINLVERGKSREYIAEMVGVTVGTLQVTCSKMGISLRRPTFDTATGALRRLQGPANAQPTATSPNHTIAVDGKSAANGINSLPPPANARVQGSAAEAIPAGSNSEPKPPQEMPAVAANGVSSQVQTGGANFAIEMRYKGEVRRTELPFDEDMIRKLALEAEFRDMRLGELLSGLMLAVMKKNLLELALEPQIDRTAVLRKQGECAPSPAQD